MPGRGRHVAELPGLTEDNVESLRQRLASGESPRVVIRSASAAVASGTRGTVVRIGDPSQDEYVVVRIKSDEVPFSPSELSLPGAKPIKAPPSAKASAPRKPARVKAAPVEPQSQPVRRTGRPTGQKARKAKPPAPLTVTLRFANGQWTAEAGRGARRLARPAPIKPGAVSALADHLADDVLRTALVETVEACRAQIEEQAAALRQQLDAAEASLRDYDSKPPRR